MKKLGVFLLAAFFASSHGPIWSAEQSDAASASHQPSSYLGIVATTTPPALASHLSDTLNDDCGVMVDEVTPGSPADEIGLKQYDVILRLNDHEIQSPEDMAMFLRDSSPGSPVLATYVEGGKIRTSKTTLAKAPREHNKPWQSPLPFLAETWTNFSHSVRPPLAPKTSWETTQTLSLMDQKDGTYRFELEFSSWDGNKSIKELTGTPDEIRQSINSDSELPKEERDYLVSRLNQRFDSHATQISFPWLENWGRELLNWRGADISAATESRVPLR